MPRDHGTVPSSEKAKDISVAGLVWTGNVSGIGWKDIKRQIKAYHSMQCYRFGGGLW